MTTLTLFFHLVVYAFMLTAAQVLMKLGLQSLESSISIVKSVSTAVLSPLFSIGFLLQAACVIYWLVLLKSNRLSIMFPIATSVAFAAITISSSLYLNEEISPRVILGTIIIIAGIFIVASAPQLG